MTIHKIFDAGLKSLILKPQVLPLSSRLRALNISLGQAFLSEPLERS